MTTTLDHLAQSKNVKKIELALQRVTNALGRSCVVFSLAIGRPITITILSSEETYTFSDLLCKLQKLVRAYPKLSPHHQNFKIDTLQSNIFRIHTAQAFARQVRLLCIGVGGYYMLKTLVPKFPF